MASYFINDLAKITGINAPTIRMWEKRYNVISPKRTNSNIRVYCDDDLRKLLNLSILRKNGYKISQIAGLTEEELKRIVLDITHSSSNVNEMEQLIIAMIEMNEGKFEKTFSNAILKYGFDETFIKIIYPFLGKVGSLWQIGSISPAQEHFISNLLRQKLIVAINSLEKEYTLKSRTFILFLNEEEMHEIGLLFYYYIIKKAGHKVIYLGAQVPFDDLRQIYYITYPDYFFTAFVKDEPEEKLATYLRNFALTFPEQMLFVTGIENYNAEYFPDNVVQISHIRDFQEQLQNV